MKSYAKVVSVLVFAVFVIGIAGASAGPFGFKGKERGQGGWMGLDLSHEQKSELATLMGDHRDAMEEQMTLLAGAMEELSVATHSPVYDEAAVVAASGKVAEARLELSLIKARIYSAFYPSLTDEQKALIEERMEGRGEAMLERMHNRLEKLDSWLGVGQE